MDVSIKSAIIGAIVGAGLTGWISYLIAKHSIKKSFELVRLHDWNKAAVDFRSAFTQIVSELNNFVHSEEYENDFVYKLIKKYIVQHEIAYIRFKPYLQGDEVNAFESSWRGYSNPSRVIRDQNPDPLIDYYAEGKGVDECVSLATNKIESLLEFAKPK
jgi:hypothetical protein